MVYKSDRTVCKWCSDLVSHNEILPESMQGLYQWTGVLWSNEDFNSKATQYIWENSAVNGRTNMTTLDLCKWINKPILPNSTLEPGYPRRVSEETARKWLLELGIEVLTAKKGIFSDGHERDDVIASRNEFIHKMIKIGFLHFTNHPLMKL